LTPRRGLLLALLLLASALAGCGADAPPGATPASEPPRPLLLALDGRWDFPRAGAEALLGEAGVGPVVGSAGFGTGILRRGTESFPLDHAAMEEAALRALGRNGTAVPQGALVAARAFADAAGLAVGDEVVVQAWRWPIPLVAMSFEMDRTRACDPEAPAKLCFTPPTEGTETELRLRVAEGAQDLAFLPDLAELGTGGIPAWWNGTFHGPGGESAPFQARVDAKGVPTPGERNGSLAQGTWTIRYTLDTAKGRAPAGLAGLVRLREPGYQWFDDRLQAYDTPQAQAEAVLARAEESNVTLRVAAIEDLPPALSAFDALLAPEDARRLRAVDADHVGGLVVMAGPDAASRLDAARERALDPVAPALHLRALAPPLPPAPLGRALVLRAPPGLDPATLPPVEGAGAPVKALALLPPVGLAVAIDGKNLSRQVRLLAPAGPAPWTLPGGARWSDPAAALENLSRSRTLVLGSADVAPPGVQIARMVMGEERTGRVAVLVGAVEGGPGGTIWASAALLAGAGEPAGARVVLPLAEGADAGQVAQRVRQAWGPLGLALEASSKP
jgi:hypothetical protein